MSKVEEIRAHRVKEFCAAVGISASTFWKYVKAGKIRVIRIGGRTLVAHSEAVRLLSEGAE
jgi:excisionase family DNA binding protein